MVKAIEDESSYKMRFLTNLNVRCKIVSIKSIHICKASKSLKWVEAMEIKIGIIEKNDAWDLALRPHRKNFIGVK